MKRSIVRSAIGLALVSGIGVAGCAHGDASPRNTEAALETGRLHMALETVSASGKVYRLRQAVFSVTSLGAPGTDVALRSEDDPSRPVLETFLAPGPFQIVLQDGWFIEQVDQLLGTSAAVDAKLETDSTQFFDIRSREETLVQYTFLVNGERVQIGPPGRLIVGIGVTERDGGPPTQGLDPRKSLLETRKDVVSAFSLEQVFTAAQANSGLAPDPQLLYHELIDTYASASNGRIPGAIHCGDETTDGSPSLNGFPLRCDRLEHLQFDNLSEWFPTAIVNRLDLAPSDGSHCGQQRVIFANNAPVGNSRMFVIFEAQVPNPNPACGIAACRPIADFWASLSAEPNAAVRGARLSEAFLTGEPGLSAQGFRPFLTVENLSVGSGSIRTNNFDDNEWTLRQFKLMSDPLGQTRVVPFPVSDAPHGALWDDTSAFSVGPGCRSSFLSALGGLLSDNPAEMAFVVDSSCLDSESPNDDVTQNYPFHLGNGSGAFRAALAAELAGTGLTPEDVAMRARFAGSCIGCHQEATGANLGHGVTAPFSNGFVQVDESFLEDCGDGSSCFTASPALKDVFLPRRLQALNTLLALPASCSTGGDGGAPPPVSADAGAPTPAPGAGGAGSADAGAPPPATVLAPNETMSDLVKQEQDALDSLSGQTTIGGQPAQVTH